VSTETKRVLFAATYPFVPGKVDAISIVSINTLSLPGEVVILPPFPGKDVFAEGTTFYRTTEVRDDELPTGVDAMEVSPETFIALNKPNPNKPKLPDGEEITLKMSKQDVLDKPWDVNLLTGEKEVSDED